MSLNQPLLDALLDSWDRNKYVALFVGLVFLSYFIFEVTAQKQVHPAQYVLVGLAQLIFYLLLLSLSEHIGFTGVSW